MADENQIDTDVYKELCNSRRDAYKELCNSYRAIDDFRTKLLGLLPLASGAGIFFLVTDQSKIDKRYFWDIGVFGFVVTLGLFLYELYGIMKCTHLIWAGRDLEIDLKTYDNGQFSRRPNGIWTYIDEILASGVIYPAVLASWTFLALAFPVGPNIFAFQALIAAARWGLPFIVFLIGFVLAFRLSRSLKAEGKKRDEEFLKKKIESQNRG
jgi:hypothetical protein